MGSNARRATGIVTAGAATLAGAALLVSPRTTSDLVTGLLAIVVVVGCVQVLVGLSLVAGDHPVDHHVRDRSAWGAGWVLDGVRAIGLAVAVWMLFAPDGRGTSLAGWVILAAVLLAAPAARRLDERAVPALAPGTYVVRATPRAQVVGLSPALRPVRVAAPARVLHVVRAPEPRTTEAVTFRRLDTRL